MPKQSPHFKIQRARVIVDDEGRKIRTRASQFAGRLAAAGWRNERRSGRTGTLDKGWFPVSESQPQETESSNTCRKSLRVDLTPGESDQAEKTGTQ